MGIQSYDMKPRYSHCCMLFCYYFKFSLNLGNVSYSVI